MLHRAVHGLDYRLHAFEEIHAQLGLTGSLTVSDDGRAAFTVTRGGQTRSRVERGDADVPVVTGPTLFGYALSRWDDLLAGEAAAVRFAVLADLRTYRFTLRLEQQDDARVVLRMAADRPLVRAAVRPLRLVFAAQTRDITRYVGLAPPVIGAPGRTRSLEAQVDYLHIADRYR